MVTDVSGGARMRVGRGREEERNEREKLIT